MNDDPGGWEGREAFLSQFYPERKGVLMPVTQAMIEAAAMETAGDPLWDTASQAPFGERMKARRQLIDRHLAAAERARWQPIEEST